MKKIVKIFITALEAILIFIVVGAFTTAITKNVYAEILIEDFKSKAIFQEDKSSNFTKIYTIESDEEILPFQKTGNIYYPGATGDILISLTSEINIPFVKEFVSFFAGGHAALVLGDYRDCYGTTDNSLILEATGLEEEIYSKVSSKYYWTTSDPYKEVICVRVKMNEKQKNKILSKIMALEGDLYNYSFIYDTKNKSYCSDIISKVFNDIGINLNKDGFTTSVYDLLVSKETYISYYHYYDSNGVKHIYYLDVKE